MKWGGRARHIECQLMPLASADALPPVLLWGLFWSTVKVGYGMLCSWVLNKVLPFISLILLQTLTLSTQPKSHNHRHNWNLCCLCLLSDADTKSLHFVAKPPFVCWSLPPNSGSEQPQWCKWFKKYQSISVSVACHGPNPLQIPKNPSILSIS